MIQIAVSLDPKTGKLGVQSNVGNKQSAIILLKAAEMILAKINEADEPRIVAATAVPQIPH